MLDRSTQPNRDIAPERYEQNYNDRIAGKLLLQSGTCQAGVNSCQIGLLAAPLPRARAAEGGPHTYLRQQINWTAGGVIWYGMAW